MDFDCSFTQSVRDTMRWIPIADLSKHRACPLFLRDKLGNLSHNIEHIVTQE